MTFYLSVFYMFAYLILSSELSNEQQSSVNLKFIDVFEGDTVKLTCKGQHNKNTRNFVSSSQHGKVSSALGPLDISVWTYLRISTAGSQQIVIALNKNEGVTSKKTKGQESIITNSGNAEGGDCVFPFTYEKTKGKSLSSNMCLPTGRKDAACWCSATKNFTKDLKWGFCPCAIPRIGVRLLAEYGTDPGSYCTFPFKFKGVEYHQCIAGGSNRCWCGTVYDVSRYRKWGYCPCAGTAFKGQWGKWGRWSSCECGEMTYRQRSCHNSFINIPTGRSVLCEGGYAIDAALCSCGRQRFEKSDLHLLSLMDRVAVKERSKKSPFSTLTLLNLTSKDSGLYFCNERKLSGIPERQNLKLSRLAVYQLNVVNLHKALSILESFGKQPPILPGTYRGDWISWKWTGWQRCDRCGILTGEMKKYGFCYTKQKARHGLQEHLISCRSPLLPPAKLARLQKYRDYILVQTCKERCHVNRIGFILIKARPDEFPSLPEVAERLVFHVSVGDTARLPCLGAHPLIPVTWQFEKADGRSPLYPILRHKNKKEYSIHGGEIGNKDELVLRNVAVTSTGYFSCFVNRTLSVSYSVVVDEHLFQILERGIDYTIYIVLFLVLFIFGGAAFTVMKSALTSKAKY